METEQKQAMELVSVTKKIGGRIIIDNLSFTVRQGEICGFLGPNGSGKTTTIRMMVGLMAMTAGEIRIAGYSIRTHRAQALARVGAIVENPELYPYMTGRKNMIHFARMAAEPVSDQRINEIVDLVGLSDAIHDKVKTYSLGMRQRLGIAQALLHKPTVLILDEPTNGLDPAGIRELRDYLRELARQEKIAILISSHLLAEVELICDRALIIQSGRLVGERAVRGTAGEDELVLVELELKGMERAGESDSSAQGYGLVKRESGIYTANISKSAIPELVADLVRDGIEVYQVAIRKPTLEDTFLQLTKGDEAL
ncbi:ABC transporter ATP-binding protein [Paenibacillus sp. FJAT-26967]|uniref:ABC transporter ATP-binding protein n=1 Tax=Paenibacillus sp. FJAT-26967 TaxID=1729690 RepID=UPI000837B7AF|nr:ABC transporter ATP-binding protein [Paenibacillus sp. FJAT-26967]